jgi:hypothetical protein
MRSLIARSLMAALTIGTLTVSQVANAQTDSNATTPVLAFGNAGLGLNNLTMGGVVPSLQGYTHTALAQGFKVGGTKRLTLSSVDLGLSIRSVAPVLDIAIYSSVNVNGLEQPGVRLRSFNTVPTNVPSLLTRSIFLYNFALEADAAPLVLQPETNYWVVLSYTPQVSGSTTFFWQFGAGENSDTPTSQTTSGFTYVGTVGRHDFANLPGGEWLDHNANSAFPNSGLRIGVYGVLEDVVVNPGGGGGTQQPPVLDCYALSKGFFRNKIPSGWPASVINSSTDPNLPSVLIGSRAYSINQLRTMLATNSTGGNQIGQLASQLVAVHLSRELAKQTAGPNFAGWDGWAPDSAAVQAAYDQAAQLVGTNAGFDTQGRLTGTLRNVSPLINLLDDGYIQRFHCD